MPYENIPGIGATYLDGAFRTIVSSNQPRVLVLGTAANGDAYNIFQINAVSSAEDEFGSVSEMLQKVHECIEQGSDNIAVMRIGGTRGEITITDTAGGWLTIKPERRDDDALSRYALILADVDGEQRVCIFDQVLEIYVYDSEEELVLDTGLVEIIDGGLALRRLNTEPNAADDNKPGPDLPADTSALMDLSTLAAQNAAGLALVLKGVAEDGTADEVVDTVAEVLPSDGLTMSKMEKYAAFEQGYQFLDYLDGDFLVPCGIHVNDLNQATGAALDFSLNDVASLPGLASPGDIDDGLGFLWKYTYRGKPHCIFLERKNAFDPKDGAGGAQDDDLLYSTTRIDTFNGSELVYDGAAFAVPNADFGAIAFPVKTALGDIGSIIALEVVDGGVGTALSVDVENRDGLIVVSVAFDDAAAAGTQSLALINTAIQNHSIANLLLDDVFVHQSGANVNAEEVRAKVTGPITLTRCRPSGGLAAAQAAVDTRIILTDVLDGDTVPTAVLKRLIEGENAEVRECNFGMQLAAAAKFASTTWSTMIGIISVTEPPAYTRAAVAEWVGQEPKYSFKGNDLSVASTADNGEGLLGIKLHAGEYAYRSAKVPEDSVTDSGYAYGGYIETEGASLASDYAYGIEDDDEALDARGKPIDLGKHLLVAASWPIHSNSYNGGSQYRGSICGALAGKLCVTPEKEEPIGINGILRSIRRPPRMRAPLTNSLAKLRFVGTRREEGVGHIIVSARTAAHPDSDYTKLSTIRSVNREISGIRTICKPFIGKEFSSTMIASMQTSINGFLKAEKDAGYNQGAVASINYTRADKIMGRLTVKLKMIPPFAIEAITVETTLAADESELNR